MILMYKDNLKNNEAKFFEEFYIMLDVEFGTVHLDEVEQFHPNILICRYYGNEICYAHDNLYDVLYSIDLRNLATKLVNEFKETQKVSQNMINEWSEIFDILSTDLIQHQFWDAEAAVDKFLANEFVTGNDTTLKFKINNKSYTLTRNSSDNKIHEVAGEIVSVLTKQDIMVADGVSGVFMEIDGLITYLDDEE